MMTSPTINYDAESDTLYISFVVGGKGTGIELSDHILLRLDKETNTAVGLTIFEYSLLAPQTEMGQRSLPLSNLQTMPPHLRQAVLAVLQTPPVTEFLTLSAFTPSWSEMIPITTLQESLRPTAV